LNDIETNHIQPILTALKANTPVLYITSVEEERVIKAIELCCIKICRKMWCHTISEGLWTVDFCQTKELVPEIVHGRANADYRDPTGILRQIKDIHMPKQGAVFLLLDFHEYLQDGLIRRHLRDLKTILKKQDSSIIILAPLTMLPQSLAHEIWRYDFPLPTRKEMEAHARTILSRTRLSIRPPLTDEDFGQIATAGQGLTMSQYESGLSGLVASGQFITHEDIIRAIIDSKKNLLKMSAALEWVEVATQVDAGGLSLLKKWLLQRRLGFSARAKSYGLPTPKGILLLGIPGCGKSLAARMISALWQVPLLRLDTGSLFTSQVGGSEERTRQALKAAEALSPCILWIDEIEKALAGVNSSMDSDAGTAARVFASLATWMQEKTAPVFVVATANSVEVLPAEMLRKGRWDDIFFIDLPGLGEREEIVSIHLKNKGQNPNDFNIRQIAEFSDGFSGAEIEQAIIAGLYEAFDNGHQMTTVDVLRAIENQVPLSITMAEDIQQLKEWASTRARPASEDIVQMQRSEWRQGKAGKIMTIREQG